MLLFAVGYNLWLYRYEPTSAVDPNDNPFQFALVYRTNQMWDFAFRECHKSPLFPLCVTGYLIDHNVPNWAQGYSLPYYYSHASQISIVASYRFLSALGLLTPITSLFTDNPQQSPLFAYYHVVIYLLLCLFPISMFLALRILKFPWLVAGFGALVASHVSTDGLYGLDPSSFLWRGYGLSSQLSSMIFMPLAIAYTLRYLQATFPDISKNNSFFGRILSRLPLKTTYLLPAVIFLTLSISGHLGLGLMTLMSVGALALAPVLTAILEKQHRSDILQIAREQFLRLSLLAGIAVFLLSYWIVPVLLASDYNNISFWDPVWKFNSWGWKEVVTQFFNGHLFDFGRFPVLTILVILGVFAAYLRKKPSVPTLHHNADSISSTKEINLQPFAVLFVFWFLLFFGRSTWGGLIDMLPGMKEFHQSRFIVGVHLAGFFLVPIGFWWISEIAARLLQRLAAFLKQSLDLLQEEIIEKKTIQQSNNRTIQPSIFLFLAIVFALATYPQTWRYANHNDVLIKQGNTNVKQQKQEVDQLLSLLATAEKGRVFTGRGGQWGKDLLLAETTYYMHLSTYGIPVILWLPETWSPNSDVEQFFIEDWKEHYDLMNVRYVVAPPAIEPKPFWEEIAQTSAWRLYQVPTSGYFTSGSHAAVVYADKKHFVNIVRLWLQSEYVKQGIFPELTFSKSRSAKHTLPNFQMVDEATYTVRGGEDFSIFGNQPRYEAPQTSLTLNGPEQVVDDMIYRTNVTVGENCTQCLAILKVTDHPNWQVYVNGKAVDHITVFPFYIGIPMSQAGTFAVEVQYQPSTLKMLLFTLSLCTLLIFFVYHLYERFSRTTIKPKSNSIRTTKD